MPLMEGKLTQIVNKQHEQVYRLTFGNGRDSIQFYIRHPIFRSVNTLANPVEIIMTNTSPRMTGDNYKDFVEAACIVEAAAEGMRPYFKALLDGTGNLNVY